MKKRWWSYQLVNLKDEDGNDCCVLYEVFWQQEGKKKPKIWMYQEATIAAETPEDAAELLLKIADDLRTLEVVQEKQLPSDKESEKEYQLFLDEEEVKQEAVTKKTSKKAKKK